MKIEFYRHLQVRTVTTTRYATVWLKRFIFNFTDNSTLSNTHSRSYCSLYNFTSIITRPR